MIRYANKYDIDKILELLKEFAIQTKSSLAKNPLTWSKTYVTQVISNILAGQGFILIDEKQTGILIAIKTATLWNEKSLQLQEVLLYGKTNIIVARLIKEYIKISKQMLNNNEINQAVIASYIGIDLSKLGLTQLQTHWEIK